MRIIFFGKGSRGICCLQEVIQKGYTVDLVIAHPEDTNFKKAANHLGLQAYAVSDPNSLEFESFLKLRNPDLFILGGYGKIIKRNIIEIPKKMTINLHGGKLPKYRGSSPLNWALINDEHSFSLSIIKVDPGIDSGDILFEKTFPIGVNDTIEDLHAIANVEFPAMLVEVLKNIETDFCLPRKQDKAAASYFPLRFPEDGLVLWDMLTDQQIHNTIRALTNPYPCAYTFFKGRRLKLIKSALHASAFLGEPGRVYQHSSDKGLLVAASNQCLWIKEAIFDDDKTSIFQSVQRYDSFLTIRNFILSQQGIKNDK